jgi:anti-sigma B factor antagonist
MALQLAHSKVGPVVHVQMKGTIVAGKDTELLTETINRMFEEGESQILLDFAQVNFIDSTGIGAILRTYNTAVRKDGAVKLLHLTKRIYDVLQITRLSSVFEIYDDLGKALASFGVDPSAAAPA